MSASNLLSKSAAKAFLWITAIAGGVIATSTVVSTVPSRDLRAMQFNGFSDTSPTIVEPEQATDSTGMLSLALGGTAVVGVGVGLGIYATRNKQQGQASRSSPNTSLQPQRTNDLYQAKGSLRRRLLLLLHEDHRAAERLVLQASFRYPGKSPDWYLEKVIYDLQRDRGVAG